MSGEVRTPSSDEVEDSARRVVTDVLDCVGIDYSTFIGRERIRANLAFLQMLREQHEDRGREFRRGIFQNMGNLLALLIMSVVLLLCGYLVGHGFTFK